MQRRPVSFCSVCSAPLSRKIPAGDSRERDCCDQCGTIHYVNPRPVVGTIPVWNDQVLLCRRAIEPRYGRWTLPAGFMEIGETTAAGALRETFEEAGARIVMGPAFTMLDVIHVEQVHIFFRAQLLDLDFAPGPESLETQLFRESEIPWNEVAFETVARTLQLFFADRSRGQFGFHTGEISGLAPAAPSSPFVQP